MDRFCSFPYRHSEATRKPETRDETGGSTKTIISCETSANFHTWKQPRWTGFAASLPYRHSEATRKPETRDETGGSTKMSISCETSANFHSWKHAKRRGFAACPIDTARPQENQRPETRHVGAPKRAFRARLPPIFTLCSFKIDVFLRVFSGT